MTEITKTHAEWAVVDRLRSMLNEAPHGEYNVTQSYGLCVAILAWVMQRIRTPEGQIQSPDDQAARSVKRSLDQQLADELPWGLRTNGPSAQDPGHGEFKDVTAFEFLRWLRDAACHGDARQIFPVNHYGRLIGFEFRPTVGGGKARSLVLTERDLRRIGSGLASLYCEALQSAASTSPGQFTDDARSMREERRAA